MFPCIFNDNKMSGYHDDHKNIYYITKQNDKKKLSLLLKNLKENKWYYDDDGNTALTLASKQGYTTCVKLLIAKDRGAINTKTRIKKINLNNDGKEEYGFTSLMLASDSGHFDVVKTLLENGADVNLKSSNGSTAFIKACGKGYTDIVQVLLIYNADVNYEAKSLKYYDGNALLAAANHNHVEIVTMLLMHGANVNFKSASGQTALKIACETGNLNLVRLLLEHGATLSIRIISIPFLNRQLEWNICEDLCYAAINGHYSIVDLLLDLDFKLEDCNYYSPMDGSKTDCRHLIRAEIDHRKKRDEFLESIKHQIHYPTYLKIIAKMVSRSTTVNWLQAEATRNKYYYDEKFFELHFIVSKIVTQSPSMNYSDLLKLSKESNKVSLLMTILTDRLLSFLKPI